MEEIFLDDADDRDPRLYDERGVLRKFGSTHSISHGDAGEMLVGDGSMYEADSRSAILDIHDLILLGLL